MSTEIYDKYREMYSKYVELSVNLHNYQMMFMKHPSYDVGNKKRRQIRDMIKLQKLMVKTSREVYFEFKENEKQAKKAARDEKNRKKRKNEQHNNTTSGSV